MYNWRSTGEKKIKMAFETKCFLLEKIEDLNNDIHFKILTVRAFEGEHFDLALTESNGSSNLR